MHLSLKKKRKESTIIEGESHMPWVVFFSLRLSPHPIQARSLGSAPNNFFSSTAKAPDPTD